MLLKTLPGLNTRKVLKCRENGKKLSAGGFHCTSYETERKTIAWDA